MISIRNLSKWYGTKQVLHDCSLDIAKGEIVVVCGPSGSGKSTLIRTLNALEPFQQGSISVDGTSLDANADLRALRARIGMVFQHFELFPHLSVLENLTLAPQQVLHKSREEATTKAHALLARVGMDGFTDAMPGQLSGGQQQRVAIARALTMDPVCMLFDEPTSALDPEMIAEVLDVMSELAKEGMTMLCVTHEMGFAKNVASRVLFMDAGRIVEDAPSAVFFAQPKSERAQQFLAKILRH
ncbi:MAG TPA: amino acid ABC transporter ATP-binding protein [Rhodocyclaceae bacterium]|nr:amino acid ABC transporter ATP-binding protein [Rhodocyclaceae bacterium]